MSAILTVFHLIVSALLVVAVLMQSSKGGGLSGAFGGDGGGMNAAFGGRGAGNFLTKATTILAVLFMLSNIAQVIVNKSDTAIPSSVIQEQLNTETSTPAANLPGLPVSTPATGTPATAAPDTTK